MSELNFLKRGRGLVLLHSGHQYYRHTQYPKGTSLWRCKFFKKKCAGSLTISADRKTICSRKEHSSNCQPDEAQNKIDNILSQTYAEAATGREPAPRVYKRAMQTIRESAVDLLTENAVPSFSNKKDTIYRNRNKVANVKKTCARVLSEVEVPQQFKDFLVADYYDGEIKILLFASKDGIARMKNLEHFFMDGTFKSCPYPFAQIFSIHGDEGSTSVKTNVFPLMYAFMSHMTSEAYSILFQVIQSQIPEWRPQKVNIDFEEAVISALLGLNPDIAINGCHYHYSNCLWRKAKALKFCKNKRNRRIVSLCGSLAHLPIEKINEGWDYIKESMPNTPEMLKYKNYFEKYWMRPHFLKIWCVFGERHRTNNAVEGWHHNLNRHAAKNQTTFLMALNMLFDDSVLAGFYSNQCRIDGEGPKPKRKKVTIENDDFIREAQVQLITGKITVGHFLEKLR